MKKRLSAAILALLCFLLTALPALAEDCFTIDVDLLDMDSLNSDSYVARELSSDTQGVRVLKYISDSSELAAPVRLTLTQMDSGALLFDKDYGFKSHTFDSGVIYLPYAGERTTPYLVQLTIGNYVYAMPFMQLPREQVIESSYDAEAWDDWEIKPEESNWEDDGWSDDSWNNDGWSDDGWSDDGWDDDYGWDDGWESDAPGWE